MKSDYTDIIMIIDKSGSMSHLTGTVIESVNSFISDQKKVPGSATFTLVEFNDYYHVSYDAVDLQTVNEYSDYRPNGMTAMNDAIGKAVVSAGIRLAAMKEEDRPSKVIVVIQTDGCENASVEYTTKMVQDMIKEQQEKYSWEFVFLGTNINAKAVAADIGININNAMFYSNTVAGASAGVRSVSENLCSYRMGTKSTMAYEDKDFKAQSDAGATV